MLGAHVLSEPYTSYHLESCMQSCAEAYRVLGQTPKYKRNTRENTGLREWSELNFEKFNQNSHKMEELWTSSNSDKILRRRKLMKKEQAT